MASLQSMYREIIPYNGKIISSFVYQQPTMSSNSKWRGHDKRECRVIAFWVANKHGRKDEIIYSYRQERALANVIYTYVVNMSKYLQTDIVYKSISSPV